MEKKENLKRVDLYIMQQISSHKLFSSVVHPVKRRMIKHTVKSQKEVQLFYEAIIFKFITLESVSHKQRLV